MVRYTLGEVADKMREAAQLSDVVKSLTDQMNGHIDSARRVLAEYSDDPAVAQALSLVCKSRDDACNAAFGSADECGRAANALAAAINRD